MTADQSHPREGSRMIANIYLVMSVVATLLLAQLLIHDEPTWIQSLAVALVALILWRGSSILLLVAVQAYLVGTETVVDAGGTWLRPALTALLTIAAFVLIDRYHTWRRFAVSDDTFLQPQEGLPAHLAAAVWIITSVLGAVLVAWTLLWWLPEYSMPAPSFRLRATELRVIVLVFVLGFLFMLVSAVRAEMIWRRSSPQQARIYLRSSLIQWLERDLRMVSRGRERRRRRATKGTWRRESR